MIDFPPYFVPWIRSILPILALAVLAVCAVVKCIKNR